VAEVSITPSLEDVGPLSNPTSVPQSKGIPKSVLDEVVVVPFNNKEVTEKQIRKHQGEIACVIVEPMLGAAGLIPQEEGYLKFLRDLTHRLNIILIFDEVITFRLGPSGAQGIYGIEPDLTTFGKIIGGGFPVGAFGGPKEIMKVFSPREKSFISHSGTFNGNPVTVAAGIACLKNLTQEVFERINSLGELLREGINLAFERTGIKGQATGMGSLAQPHMNSERVMDYRSAAKGNFSAVALVHLGLLERGINMAPRGECSISTPMSKNEIKAYLTAFEECLAEVKPFVEEASPDLIQ
jgi:glutamate-1-semialdehyde 2,1-aminomutase